MSDQFMVWIESVLVPGRIESVLDSIDTDLVREHFIILTGNRNGLYAIHGSDRFGLAMGVVKDDDSKITWDSKAMEHGR